jgi:hypothetical protein
MDLRHLMPGLRARASLLGDAGIGRYPERRCAHPLARGRGMAETPCRGENIA